MGREWTKNELRALEEHLMGLGAGRASELRENVRAATSQNYWNPPWSGTWLVLGVTATDDAGGKVGGRGGEHPCGFCSLAQGT